MEQPLQPSTEQALLDFIQARHDRKVYSFDVAVNMKAALRFLTRNEVWPDSELLRGLTTRLESGFAAALARPGVTLARTTTETYKGYLKRLVRDFSPLQETVWGKAAEGNERSHDVQAEAHARLELGLGPSILVNITVAKSLSQSESSLIKSQVVSFLEGVTLI